jgi:hypothetical protein
MSVALAHASDPCGGLLTIRESREGDVIHARMGSATRCAVDTAVVAFPRRVVGAQAARTAQ